MTATGGADTPDGVEETVHASATEEHEDHDELFASPEEERNFRERNEQLRSEFLQQTLRLKRAREAGDLEEAEKAARDRARIGSQFVELNTPLAAKNAGSFMIGDGHNRKDYLQAALLGMWEAFMGTSADALDAVDTDEDGNAVAAAGWDPRRGTFATLAKQHIRGRVKRAVNSTEQRYAGMSYNTWSEKPKVDRAKAALQEELGRTATVAEIARKAGVTVETVRACITAEPVSLQTLVSDDGTMTLGDKIAATPADTGLADTDEVEQLLVERAAEIGALRLFVLLEQNGLNGEDKVTVNTTASDLCVGRGVIGKAEEQAKELLITDRLSVPGPMKCDSCREEFTYAAAKEPSMKIVEPDLPVRPEDIPNMDPEQYEGLMAAWKAEVDALTPALERQEALLVEFRAKERIRALKFADKHRHAPADTVQLAFAAAR